jgi:23S rRNA-/tRNA-specific pseudouridylate synthase
MLTDGRTAGQGGVPELPLGAGVRVVAQHPAGLLALDKPAGLISHPNRDGVQSNTLLAAPYDLAQECYQLPYSPPLYLLNRIDSPTSGLVLAATDPTLAAKIREIFKSRHTDIAKTYYAVVKGTRFDARKGFWRDCLTRSTVGGLVRVHAGAGGIPALTHYEVLATANTPTPLALLRLAPKTGRTHQLRVQCATHAHPIIGDKTYGDFALNRRLEKLPSVPVRPDFRRLFLHAHAITLVFTWKGRPQTFTAISPLPDYFTLLFKSLA